MNSDLDRYFEALATNADALTQQYPNECAAFRVIDSYFASMFGAITRLPMSSGKTLISFLPALALVQRQSRNAFVAFQSRQSYQAWQILRPGLEMVLVTGKWLDDKAFVDIWKNRTTDWESYRRAYTGKNLESANLPNSQEIRLALKSVNDDYMHSNDSFYHRHLGVEETEDHYLLSIDYFDSPEDFPAHFYAFLHLVCLVVSSVGEMLALRYEHSEPFKTDYLGFIREYGPTARQLARDEVNKNILTTIGRWPAEAFQ